MNMGFKLSAVFAAMCTLGGCATSGLARVEGNQKNVQNSGVELVERARSVTPASPLFSKQPTFWVERTPLPVSLDPASQLPHGDSP